MGKPGPDGVAQGRVGHGDGRQARHEQGHQPEDVGDDGPGVLAQAVADEHPQTGADEHREDVEHGPGPGEQRGHAAQPTAVVQMSSTRASACGGPRV